MELSERSTFCELGQPDRGSPVIAVFRRAVAEVLREALSGRKLAHDASCDCAGENGVSEWDVARARSGSWPAGILP